MPPDPSDAPDVIVCPGIGGFVRMLSDADTPMSRVSIEAPTIVLVVQGSLRLRWAGHECTRAERQAVAVAEGQTFDMIVRPPTDGNPFEAHLIRCDPTLTATFAEAEPAGQPIRDAYPVDRHAEAFAEAFRRLTSAMTQVEALPPEVPALRARELLAWLSYSGAFFGRLERSMLTRRIRMTIARDIDAEWTIGRMADTLALSTSTLRRRLTEEGASFHNLLIDVRMSRALTLLQVTDLPVLQIAYRTGYDSPSRFTARFRQRFGISPSEVRTANSRV